MTVAFFAQSARRMSSNTSIPAIDIVTALAIIGLAAFSGASGINSDSVIQIIAPAARPNPTGRKGVKKVTNMKEGTAKIG